MTVEISLLLSGISVAFAVYFGMVSKKRNDRKDTEQETADRTQANTAMMVKLENIANDLKEIKAENRNFREDIGNLRERIAKVESSLKSYHKRLDEERAVVDQ